MVGFKRLLSKTILPLIVLAALVFPAIAADQAVPPEVTQYAKDWPLVHKDYNNTRATTDAIINSSNVNELGMAWSVPINITGTFGGLATTPIVMGDTVYFQDIDNNFYAVDFNTGAMKWSKIYDVHWIGPTGVAVGWGKVFGTSNTYDMVALDKNNGTELWNTSLSNYQWGKITMQPQIYDGMVFTSVPVHVTHNVGGIGYFFGLYQNNGTVMWGASGVDSANIWGHPELNSGGGAWMPPAVDTKTDTLYWGTKNPGNGRGPYGPYSGTKEYPNGSSRPGANLYTNCMISMDPKTGDFNWYTQVYPHDLFDYDFMLSPILASANINGMQQDIVIGSGKLGRVYAFNRSTGAILWCAVVGEHNGIDQWAYLPDKPIPVLPGTLGGVETPMAYSDGVVYAANDDLQANYSSMGDVGTAPISTGKGGLTAIQADTGKFLWVKKFDTLCVGAATIVNDLVMTATFDGTIYAFKKDTGEQVWTYKAPAGINGWPAVANDSIVWPCGLGKTQMICLRLGATGTSNMTATQEEITAHATNATIAAHSFMQIQNASMQSQNMATVSQNMSSQEASNKSMNVSTMGDPSGKDVTIDLIAKNIAYNRSTITVPAGANVTVNFDNQDASIPHNFAVYETPAAEKVIFRGDIITGPAKTTYNFTAPDKPGTYFFRCDVHPSIMTGQFVVT
jgi:outer membrane protein assembly factor BamB/plastocyanin